MNGRLFLIPNLISDTDTDAVIPSYVKTRATSLKHFVVENIKVSRRFLKKIDKTVNIDSIAFYAMGKHSDELGLQDAIQALKKGEDVGVISDAGCPGIADPGAEIVGMAQREGIQVTPLVGPSSILLTLIASGLNGQEFSFHGYLPKDRGERKKRLNGIVSAINRDSSSHLFMDTPFRNMNMLEDVLNTCPGDMMLCIAKDITGEKEWIKTMTIQDWKKKRPELNKIPVMFALGH